jgi:predicted esterase
MQKQADAAGAVIAGFPGTLELPDGTRRWSEDPATDDAYVQARLRDLAKETDLDLSRVALFGFSEGGLVAAELATTRPDRYLGAIVMSPGGTVPPRLAGIPRAEHRRQVYLLFCNAGESPSVVALTRALASRLRGVAGATVRLEISAGSLHARPPGFPERLPRWLGAILRNALDGG